MATGHDGRSLFRSLGAVLGTALLAVLDALGVKHAAQDVVAHARQVLDAAPADHDHRVLLQVMALARYVADHLEAVGEAHLGDLAQRRVRLLRRRRIDARADAALLRTLLERRHLLLRLLHHPRLADQLIDRRHARLLPLRSFLKLSPKRLTAPRPTDAARTRAQNEIAPSTPAVED